MNNYFIILASGQSKRFNSNKLKQYIIYKNKPLFEHSIEKALVSKLFKKIILVVNNKKQINKKFSKNVVIIKGGKERSDSSLIGLKYIKKFKPSNVLIHDAARPNFSLQLLKNLVKSLKKNKAVIPTVNTKDSIKYKVKKQLFIEKNVFWALGATWCILGTLSAHGLVAFLITFLLMYITSDSNKVKSLNRKVEVFDQKANHGPKHGRSNFIFLGHLNFSLNFKIMQRNLGYFIRWFRYRPKLIRT